MKIWKFISLLISGLAFVFVLSSCSKTSDVNTLRLGHGLSTDHPVHQAMVYMTKRVKKKSDGQLSIKLYPNQQLGTERELLELLQIGSLDITKVSSAVLSNFSPRISVFGLPYLFRDNKHRFAVLDGKIGKNLLEAPQQYLLRGLAYYDAGYRSFYTKNTPVQSPEDLQGLKIRVMESKTAIAMVNEMDGSATPISWGELYSALQQGIVDGAENNPPSFETSHHYEVCKYYSLDEHTAVPDILLIGTKSWNKLTEKEQQWLQEAADESKEYQRELWAKAEKDALEKVKNAGVKVIRPDKEPFIKKTQPVYDQLKENNPELYKLAQDIRAINP